VMHPYLFKLYSAMSACLLTLSCLVLCMGGVRGLQDQEYLTQIDQGVGQLHQMALQMHDVSTD
jgi:hypothetical protein